MPYITQEARQELSEERNARTVGELNYLVTGLVAEYIYRVGPSYNSINAAIGVLECAKLELYRRIAGPYEDKAIAKNGDVYGT